MQYQAENQGGNFWIVTATDAEGEQAWTKKVFCNINANTEADAIAVATAEPVGD